MTDKTESTGDAPLDIDNPEHYVVEKELEYAVLHSVKLGLPLLVVGEPGTGKRQLAAWIAHNRGLPFFTFRIKTTSIANDLLYQYRKQLHACHIRQKKKQTDIESFIHYQALGKAILLADPTQDVKPHLSEKQQKELKAILLADPTQDVKPHLSEKQREELKSKLFAGSNKELPVSLQSVVLLDGIDKAQHDLVNDVLNEIEKMEFTVEETGKTFRADDKKRPILILTGNSEDSLPDAFLHRCIFYQLCFPSRKHLMEIATKRFPHYKDNPDSLEAAVNDFYEIRGLTKKRQPNTTEFLLWLQNWRLFEKSEDYNEIRRKCPKAFFTSTYSILAKTRGDLDSLKSKPSIPETPLQETQQEIPLETTVSEGESPVQESELQKIPVKTERPAETPEETKKPAETSAETEKPAETSAETEKPAKGGGRWFVKLVILVVIICLLGLLADALYEKYQPWIDKKILTYGNNNPQPDPPAVAFSGNFRQPTPIALGVFFADSGFFRKCPPGQPQCKPEFMRVDRKHNIHHVHLDSPDTLRIRLYNANKEEESFHIDLTKKREEDGSWKYRQGTQQSASCTQVGEVKRALYDYDKAKIGKFSKLFKLPLSKSTLPDNDWADDETCPLELVPMHKRGNISRPKLKFDTKKGLVSLGSNEERLKFRFKESIGKFNATGHLAHGSRLQQDGLGLGIVRRHNEDWNIITLRNNSARHVLGGIKADFVDVSLALAPARKNTKQLFAFQGPETDRVWQLSVYEIGPALNDIQKMPSIDRIRYDPAGLSPYPVSSSHFVSWTGSRSLLYLDYDGLTLYHKQLDPSGKTWTLLGKRKFEQNPKTKINYDSNGQAQLVTLTLKLFRLEALSARVLKKEELIRCALLATFETATLDGESPRQILLPLVVDLPWNLKK
ncbi:MAG: AAA family ATPase [Gammaproteobacteria bacterium]|nr:AAA family ATPase [Gammaproteobacteria bacterium]